MGKQRSGRLSNEHVWRRTPRPRRHCGVSNGFQRREGTKGLQQQARIAASPFIGKLQEVEPDILQRGIFCLARMPLQERSLFNKASTLQSFVDSRDHTWQMESVWGQD